MPIASSPSSPSLRRIAVAPLDVDENENRTYRRFELALSGRFMRASKEEYGCRINDISVGGLSLTVDPATPVTLTAGENVIAYISQLGGLEGPVLRTWSDGFAVKLNATQHKREKLAAQITWLLNERDLNGAAARRHERLHIANRDATIALGAGGFLPCLILDISLSGASVACKPRPEIGEEVWLARLRARVVRHHSEGIGLQFMQVLDAGTMQAYFG